MLAALIIIPISVGLIVAGFFYFKRKLSAPQISLAEEEAKRSPELDKEIKIALEQGAGLISKGQIETALAELTKAQSALEGEKARLKEIESKLDTAQKTVEEKETHHQEVKTAKEDEESKLQELLNRYKDISGEAMGLEQRLASSMKNLDSLLSEVQLTAAQRGAFDELENTLSSAGERMRVLLTEYQTVNERLELLQQQHRDLEMEYTRLVEQQLGEA